jgi:hypothetical protein
MHKPKPADHLWLPLIGSLSAGIVTFLVAGIIGFHPLELAIPLLGAAFGRLISAI